MGDVTPMMPPETWAALERLLEVVRADTHQARYAANFLLAWWNAGDLGGFDLTEAWGLDDTLREDLVTLFGFHRPQQDLSEQLQLPVRIRGFGAPVAPRDRH